MSDDLFKDLLEEVINIAETHNQQKGIWREKPVDLVTFFKEYLGETPYPGKQTELLEIVNKILNKDDLPENDPLREVTEVVAMWGKGCKAGSATIYDAETGKRWTIKELAEREGDFVFKVTALDPKTQKLVKATASKPSKIGVAPVYRVVTNTGHETVVTMEHVFMTRERCERDKNGLWETVNWKRLADLKVGDYIALATKVYGKGKRFDPREMRLIGYWLGDGSFTSPYGDGHFLCSNPEVEKDYCEILRSYGIEPKYPEYANEKRTDRNCKVIKHSLTPWESRRGFNPINSIAKKYGFCGVNAYNKRVPEQVFEADEKSIIEMLRALFATDGWVSLMNNGRTLQIGYCSVSKGLVQDIQSLLLRLGIVARIKEKKTNSKHGIAYQLVINDKLNVTKFCEKIKIIGKDDKQNEYLKAIEHNKQRRVESDIYWARIKSIEYVGEEEYYDLSVMGYGNYVSDGFIDHNSGKDFIISGIVAYIPYYLNCMYDPQGYFGFGKGEPIDIINIAKNAKQAENVFFTKLKARLRSCSWFKKVDRPPEAYNEYQEKKDTIIFYNNIRAFSGHSEAASFEGFNPLVAIFDEVGDFEWNLAEFCYDTLRSSAISRFGKRALLLFISYPRSADDFIMYKYKQGQDPEFPEVISSKGTTWEVNPSRKKEDFAMDYAKDPEGAKMRFECIPPAQRGGFFQYPERIDQCVKPGKVNPCTLEEIVITETLHDGQERHFIGYDVELFRETLELDPSKTYYLGLDGGLKSDSFALSLFHAEVFYEEVLEGGEAVEKARNKPVEVLLIEWKPDQARRIPVSVQNVIDIVEVICQKVFVKKALMDGFNSGALLQKLAELGVEAEDKVFSNPFQLSIYTQFKNLAYTGHLELLDYEQANEDMKHIQLVNGNKIDHEKGRSKDTCDARCAAVYLCATDEPEEITNWAMPVILGAVRQY